MNRPATNPERVSADLSMPQSLSAVYIHFVFSVKDRRPLLRNLVLRDSIHAYVGSVYKHLDCPALAIGGTENHIHVLACLARTVSQADWVKEVKRVSTGWTKRTHADLKRFEWQGGYAAFSVSQSNVPQVMRYIARQEEHHKKATFQAELRLLMTKHSLDWDERYVWD